MPTESHEPHSASNAVTDGKELLKGTARFAPQTITLKALDVIPPASRLTVNRLRTLSVRAAVTGIVGATSKTHLTSDDFPRRTAMRSSKWSPERSRRSPLYRDLNTDTETLGPVRGVPPSDLSEFGPDVHIVSVCEGSDVLRKKLSELLPDAFGPANLK